MYMIQGVRVYRCRWETSSIQVNQSSQSSDRRSVSITNTLQGD